MENTAHEQSLRYAGKVMPLRMRGLSRTHQNSPFPPLPSSLARVQGHTQNHLDPGSDAFVLLSLPSLMCMRLQFNDPFPK